MSKKISERERARLLEKGLKLLRQAGNKLDEIEERLASKMGAKKAA